MNKRYSAVVVISYGAIGDFVMLLYFLAALHAQRIEKTRYIVLTTTNTKLLHDMAGAYDFVEIVPMTTAALMRLWVGRGLKNNLMVIPPTFVDVPWFVRVITKLFSLRGTSFGFTGRANIPHVDLSVVFEMHAPIHESFDKALELFGYRRSQEVRLQFREDATLLKNLSEGYVVVAPFASNPGKSLPPERWHKLFAFLQNTYPKRDVVLIGGPADAKAAETYSTGGHVHNYCGVPFAQVVSLLKGTNCFIGVDSGLTHVAGVLRMPSVVIDNLRAVTWLPTYNPKAIILTEKKHCVCGGDKTGDCNYIINGVSYLRCMYDVSDERIQDAIAETVSQ